MTDTLRDRIAAAIAAHEPVTDYGGADGECIDCDLNPRWPDSEASTGPTAGWKRHATHLADAVSSELGQIPDRTHTDDQGRTWEWCGGQPGTWAWRVTNLHGARDQ